MQMWPMARLALAISAMAGVIAPMAGASAQDRADGRGAARPSPAAGDAPAGASPRYLRAMDEELEALQIAHACEASSGIRAMCSYVHRGRTTNREFTVTAIYSDETDTIYFYVGDFLLAPPDAASTPALLRRMMEINWQLLVGKVEWDSSSGEARVSMVVHTDSNFDRRSFRSVARTVGMLADRYYGELSRLQAMAEAE